MTRARMDPLTPLPEDMIRLAREALEAGLPVAMSPATAGFVLAVCAPDEDAHTHWWTPGPDGVWSRKRTTPTRVQTRAMIARHKTACGELDDALYDGIPATRVIYCPTPNCPACTPQEATA